MSTNMYLKKVFKTIERNRLVEKDDRIFVALSGGKDSTSCLYCLKKFSEEKRIDCEINGFYINLDNSPEVLNSIRSLTEYLDVELIEIEPPDIKKYKGSRPICSICGVVKRYLINKIPREKGATKIATGHNMDDFIVFFLKNLIGKKYSWISNFKPRVDSNHPKLLTRIRPLFNVGNKEDEEFCKKMNLPFAEKHVCRFKAGDCNFNRKIENWYRTIYDIEKWNKNFRHQLVSAIEEISILFAKEEKLKECSICGEPTSKDVCAYCKIFSKN